MQSAFIQTVETSVFVPTVLKAEAKFAAQTGGPTNTRANSRSMLARKTSALQWFHWVDVEASQKHRP